MPESLFGDWVSLKTDPKPPDTFGLVHAGSALTPPAQVRLSVSPVSSNQNSVKFEPGRKTPFSGRLNGVAPAAFASALSSAPGNGADAIVLSIVIHLVGHTVL